MKGYAAYVHRTKTPGTLFFLLEVSFEQAAIDIVKHRSTLSVNENTPRAKHGPLSFFISCTRTG